VVRAHPTVPLFNDLPRHSKFLALFWLRVRIDGSFVPLELSFSPRTVPLAIGIELRWRLFDAFTKPERHGALCEKPTAASFAPRGARESDGAVPSVALRGLGNCGERIGSASRALERFPFNGTNGERKRWMQSLESSDLMEYIQSRCWLCQFFLILIQGVWNDCTIRRRCLRTIH
jgi:hypothetical protein